jgi:hypothetical protein
MTEPVEQLRHLSSARKSVSRVTIWKSASRGEAAICRLDAPLSIQGHYVPGLKLKGTAQAHLPDQDVTLQLVYQREIYSRRFHLVRVEWRPLRTHFNDGGAPAAIRFRQIVGSHYHPFDLNSRRGLNALLASHNLPVAVPLEPEPRNYWEFLDIAGQLLNIDALAQIGEPPWAPRLSFAL